MEIFCLGQSSGLTVRGKVLTSFFRSILEHSESFYMGKDKSSVQVDERGSSSKVSCSGAAEASVLMCQLYMCLLWDPNWNLMVKIKIGLLKQLVQDGLKSKHHQTFVYFTFDSSRTYQLTLQINGIKSYERTLMKINTSKTGEM